MRTVSVSAVIPHGTVAIGRGIDERGHCVEFAGDWRPMMDIADAIRQGRDSMDVKVDDRSIIRDSRPAFEIVS